LDEPHEPSPLERFCAVLAAHGVEFMSLKRYLGRPKDRESLLQLEAIKRLREREGLR
jgi:hypothetical protein